MNIHKIAKALGHETRYQILKTLAARKEVSCGEMVDLFPLSQPTISYHLKILQEVGLVNVRKKKQFAYFSVNFAVLKDYQAAIEALLPEDSENENEAK